MTALRNRLGARYGRLEVIGRAPNAKGNAVWNCVCDCGNEVSVEGIRLGRNVNSCGCLKHDLMRAKMVKDDRTKHPLYKTWINMINRCHNPKATQFNDYGGRMIFVCQTWRDSFWQFIEDIGPKPSNRHTLERKDNNMGYSKDNCVWATYEEQCKNSRKREYV